MKEEVDVSSRPGQWKKVDVHCGVICAWLACEDSFRSACWRFVNITVLSYYHTKHTSSVVLYHSNRTFISFVIRMKYLEDEH